jgi:clathrin heavy chain
MLLFSAGGAVKRNAELFFPAEFADDFPVSLQVGGGHALFRQLSAVAWAGWHGMAAGQLVS